MTTYPPIAICGPIGHGKTSVAKILAGYGAYRIISFADPIRKMLEGLGVTDHDMRDRELKETPHPILCGKTPRHALQVLGTEWGRHLIGHEVWVNAWRHRVEGSPIFGAIADDCRYLNESRVIKQMGGTVWRVVDPRKEIPDGHLSEKEWMLIDADVSIVNDGSLDDLAEKVQREMETKGPSQ